MSNIFLGGEKIDLCIPEDGDFEQWAGWFNDQKITHFLEQGKFPNTIEQQKKFYGNAIEAGRFLTLIKDKDGELLGVISLSEINFEKKSCQIALVCPRVSKSAILAPLEAMAIVTQHAFVRFGMEYIWAGQPYPGLLKWVQKLEVLGYKTDGVFPNEFRHGFEITDSVRTSLTKDRFLEILKIRGNNLWPGEDATRKIIKELKKRESLAEKINMSIKYLHKEHDKLLFTIEDDLGK